MYHEKEEGTKVVFKCPVNDRALCTWFHEDRPIPMNYGGWTVTSKGSLVMAKIKIEDSGTYTVMVNKQRYINHLGEFPVPVYLCLCVCMFMHVAMHVYVCSCACLCMYICNCACLCM